MMNINRIIIVGNGFDLSHGLATGYKDFIYWYWHKTYTTLSECTDNTYSDGLCTFTISDKSKTTWNVYLADKPFDKKTFYNFLDRDNAIINICESNFMNRICQSIELKGWVDIENEYYNALKQEYFKKPNQLNYEFSIIRNNLIEYLTGIQRGKINKLKSNQSLWEKIMAPMRVKEIAISARPLLIPFITQRLDYNSEENDTIGDITGLTSNKEKYSDIKKFLKGTPQIEYMGIESIINHNDIPRSILYPSRLMLLNFNYTTTADLYIPQEENSNFIINHIHGNLNNPNSIIFGYGDELDDKYKDILNANDNEYLQNIKSIRYLETPNYHNMLEFIESAPYQIYIMGHSCGNSDRTLLNTLFEHKNCISIKPFYYVKADGSDDYLEIIKNISRSFTNMKLMRDRIVNKTYCESM